jgi:hypothetical protein
VGRKVADVSVIYPGTGTIGLGMESRSLRQLSPASGLAFVALGLLANVVVGFEGPQPEDPPAAVVEFLTEERDALIASTFLWGVASVFFMWFLGSLYARLRRAEGEVGELPAVALTGGALVLAFGWAGALPVTALSWRGAEAFEPRTVQLIYDIHTVTDTVVTAIPGVAFVLAASVVILRTSTLPRWIGYAGLLTSLSFLFLLGEIFFARGRLAPGGSFTYLLNFLFTNPAFGLWVVVTSASMLRKGARSLPQ